MPFDMEQAFGEFKADFDKVTASVQQNAQAALDENKRLGGLTADTKAAVDKALAEQGELKTRLEEIEASSRDMEQRFASGRRGGASAEKSLGAQVIAAEAQIKAARENGVHGDLKIGVFNAITSLPGSGGALLPEQRDSDFVTPPNQKMVIKDLITVGETSGALIKFFRELSRTGAAGIVPDDGVTVKPLIDKTWEAASEEVRTIAGRMEIHKHMLDDLPALRTDIDNTLRYEVDKAENAQILAGDGSDEYNMSGLITNATLYAQTAREPATVTILDRLRLAMLQVSAAGYVTDGHVLSIWDWAAAEMLKDTTNRYIYGNPFQETATPRLWGRPVVDTEAMPEGDFLSGAFKLAATYYERQEIEILLSSENRDNFDKNMLTVRGEKRGVLAVKRPLALCYYNTI